MSNKLILHSKCFATTPAAFHNEELCRARFSSEAGAGACVSADISGLPKGISEKNTNTSNYEINMKRSC